MHFTFTASYNIAVVYTDTDYADSENPRGEIYGKSVFVEAYDHHGNTRTLDIGVDDRFDDDNMQHAVELAAALNMRMRAGRLPINFNAWKHGEPIFGSVAWIQSGNYSESREHVSSLELF